MKVIVTGASGMVGEGVLHECLMSDEVEKVLVINRKPCGVVHQKLTEFIHSDFFDLTSVKHQFAGYNACFFNLGVSSIGMKPDLYQKLTYDLTLNFAESVLEFNSDMTFCYVSGAGTDSSEKGKVRWARVKGKTENDILKLGFKQAYAFRPAFIQPTKGLKNTYNWYKALGFTFPFWKWIMPNYVISLKEIGLAMINSVVKGYHKDVLECADIRELAKK